MVVLGISVFKFGQSALEEATGGQSLSDIVDSLEDDPVKTLAEAAIRLNPEFEWISTDEDAGTITFLHIESEQEGTMSFSDIAEGRFTMTTKEGELVIDGAQLTEEYVDAPYRFEVLEGVSHWIPDLAPDRMTALLLDHLAAYSER